MRSSFMGAIPEGGDLVWENDGWGPSLVTSGWGLPEKCRAGDREDCQSDGPLRPGDLLEGKDLLYGNRR